MILHQEGQTCKQCRPFVKGGEQNHKTRSVCEQQLLKRKDNPKQIQTVYRWSTHHLSTSSTTEPVRPRSMTGHYMHCAGAPSCHFIKCQVGYVHIMVVFKEELFICSGPAELHTSYLLFLATLPPPPPPHTHTSPTVHQQ